MKFKDFLKSKGAIGAIFMALFYQLAMIGIFMPAYTAIPNNTDQLPITIVNDDAGEIGATITAQLKENLPFEDISTNLSNKQALEQLDDNDTKLVIHIPETFSADAANGETVSAIDFTINQSAPSVVTSTMSSVAAQVTTMLNKQFSLEYSKGTLLNFNLPEEQAAALAESMQTQLTSNMININEVPAGMNNVMTPMFITMAGYVGSMIAAMQLVATYRAHRGKASKLKRFLYMQLTALLLGIVAPLIGLGITFLVHGHGAETFLSLWGLHALGFYVCFQFTSIFILLLGEGGMVLNIPVLLVQTISNGATIPREMMYAPYEWFSHISPMYYSVQSAFSILYGGGDLSASLLGLLAVGAAALLINIAIVAFLHKDAPAAKEAKEEIVNENKEVLV
jgi:cation transporter-like permease